MKSSQPFLAVALGLIFILTLGTPRASNGAPQHGFRFKEYELFHDVLHPLQHEALPKRDFQRIRTMARELTTRGKAIVKLGVPDAPKPARRKFAETRRKFDRALTAFNSDARKGSDSRLEKSFTAVHDSFEELADLVPTVHPSGPPPTVFVNCPSVQPEAGSKITLTAATPLPEELLFTWVVSGGKIVSGQDTPTITVDTSGLAGQTISVSVEVNDGNGLTASANCKVQIAPAQDSPEILRCRSYA